MKRTREVKHHKVRMKVAGTADRPRLCVFRSNAHIYAQIIDDEQAKTLVSASDTEIKAGKAEKSDFRKVDLAKKIGSLIAEKAVAKKIKKVVFDRGGYIYTGRVKSLAEGAREGGLEF